MRVQMLLPALTEAVSPFFRPIKYSLFPPLGLASLAAWLDPQDDVVLQDEHVERLRLDDEPDVVALEVYVTSARRAYEIADSYRRRGVHVCLGGLHVTSLPREAMAHADTIFLGPGEDTWPRFLRDFRRGAPRRVYRSTRRDLAGAPRPRRDLIRRSRYLVPNSIVVSRGCPHDCDFCYKGAFFRGGTSFYVRAVDEALAEIETLPGRHLFFLDDNLFASRRFAAALFDGLRGMGRVWQAAATVRGVLDETLLDRAAGSGLGSLFIGFETLDRDALAEQNKRHNLSADYDRAVRLLKDRGVMINGSFVFGMDSHGRDVFDRTVDWAIERGLETATFHILTPYPGTPLRRRLEAEGRILGDDWDLHDTRHCVFRPARMAPEELEQGYREAYRRFYRWSSLFRSAAAEPTLARRARHLAYAAGWKKAEPLWAFAIHAGILGAARPVLERVLGPGARPSRAPCASRAGGEDEANTTGMPSPLRSCTAPP